MVELADAELVERARGGDRLAFDALLGPLVDPGFRLAYGLLHDRESAEDAVQEAALRAWRKLGNLRPGSPLRPWFLAIVANQARSTRRQRWWSVIRLEAGPDVSRAGFEDPVVRGADVRRALRSLPHDQRLAIVLHFYLDLPLEEVAAITAAPVGTVKSRIHRGVARMRPELGVKEAYG